MIPHMSLLAFALTQSSLSGKYNTAAACAASPPGLRQQSQAEKTKLHIYLHNDDNIASSVNKSYGKR